NEFIYKMNRDEKGDKLKVTIDGSSVDKLDLGYVALMANQVVRIGACAQIYGDVYSRTTIETSAGCGITDNPNAIVGSLSSQGRPPYTNNIQQHNTFGHGSNIIVPSSEYTNSKNKYGQTTIQIGRA